MQAAIATAGCAMAMFSRSIEPIHSPPDLITSLLRSVICMKPSASMVRDVAGREPAVDQRVAAFALEVVAR